VPRDDDPFAIKWGQQNFFVMLGNLVIDELSPPAHE
jgi:hypothetical protein